ncbi:MAG: TolC family protein [Acidobacteriia bacterium]|nr:TolC family protein [Terriglobia bacterium]
MRAVLFFLLVASVVAQPSLDLKDLTAEALSNNREILVAQKRYEAARQRPRQAGALPDPMFSVGYSSNGNPLPGAGLGSNPTSNIGFSVTQSIPYPGKRELRENVANKEAAAELEQYQLVQLNVIARLKQAFFRLQHSYAAHEVMDRNREVLRQLLKVTEARYSVGKAAQQDIFKTQTQLSVIEVKVLQLEQEHEAAEAEILSLLDRPPGTVISRPEEPHIGDFTVTLEELYTHALSEAPTLRREQKMIERAELAVNLAHKDYHPDYAVTGGYYNQGSMSPMYTFRLDLNVPLFVSRKLRPAVTEQMDNLAAARHSYEATEQTIHARIRQDYTMARTSLDLMKLYRETVIPQAKLAIESSLASYETGAVDFLSVLTNYMAVVDFEMEYHEEMQKYHIALTRLEEATGLALIH